MSDQNKKNSLFANMSLESMGDVEGVVAAACNQIMARLESEIDFDAANSDTPALREHLSNTLHDCDSIACSLHDAVTAVKLHKEEEFNGFHAALADATSIIDTEIGY